MCSCTHYSLLKHLDSPRSIGGTWRELQKLVTSGRQIIPTLMCSINTTFSRSISAPPVFIVCLQKHCARASPKSLSMFIVNHRESNRCHGQTPPRLRPLRWRCSHDEKLILQQHCISHHKFPRTACIDMENCLRRCKTDVQNICRTRSRLLTGTFKSKRLLTCALKSKLIVVGTIRGFSETF